MKLTRCRPAFLPSSSPSQSVVFRLPPDRLCFAVLALDAAAQYNVGIAYRDGSGVTRDLDKALKFLQLAAAETNEEASVRVQASGAAAGVLLTQVSARMRCVQQCTAVAGRRSRKASWQGS